MATSPAERCQTEKNWFFAGVVGLGFEVIEDCADGVGSWKGIALGEEVEKGPVAEGGRADREDEETAGGRLVEADEGLAIGGGEGDAAVGDPEEIAKSEEGIRIPQFKFGKRDREGRAAGTGSG